MKTHIWGMVSFGRAALSTPRTAGVLVHFCTEKCSCFRSQTSVIYFGVLWVCLDFSWCWVSCTGAVPARDSLMSLTLSSLSHVSSEILVESYPGHSTCCRPWLQIGDGDNSEMKPFQAAVSSTAEPQPWFPQNLLNTWPTWAALRAVSCAEPPLPPGEFWLGSGKALVHKL